MKENQVFAKSTFTVEEAARVMGRGVNEIESLIRNKKLGFEIGQYGPVISAADMNTYYLGGKPKQEPSYKPEKLKRKKPKFYVKAKTRR